MKARAGAGEPLLNATFAQVDGCKGGVACDLNVLQGCNDAILHVSCVHQLLNGICNTLEDPWYVILLLHVEPSTRYTEGY